LREFDDTEVLEVAIIENIQRADLNPIEEARAFRQLMDSFGHTQEKLAEALSKSRSYIANLLRLLSLPDDVQGHLRQGRLTAGHARALITAKNPSELALQVISRNLSVRDTEALAKRDGVKPQKTNSKRQNTQNEKDADTRAIEADLSANLKMAVTISHEPGGEAGILQIRYKKLDDLDNLCRSLSVMSQDFDS
jgi:ParB family chromosome partitioning protein